MTVEQLVIELMKHDQSKRVVVSDTDGAGKQAVDIEFVDQRVEKGKNVITIWVHV
jgi:KaiC/GvpD/RAD55 family RecA-like ATPase